MAKASTWTTFCHLKQLLGTQHCHQFRTPLAFMSTNKFWEADRKGGYDTKMHTPSKKLLKEGFGMLGTELGKFKEEVKHKFRADPVLGLEPGDYEVLWEFDNKEISDNWIITCDSDHNEGNSNAKLVQTRNKTAIFCGNIHTEVPKDGIIKESGYANIRSPKNMVGSNQKMDIFRQKTSNQFFLFKSYFH